MIRRLVRRWLGLPPARCDSAAEQVFVPMRDGVRLSTWHVWPIDGPAEAGTIVMRTPYGASLQSPTGLAARLLAESGHHVILQDVRGRFASEGRFVPFENEQSDGADTLGWVTAQPWASGPVGLFGASYLAYTAWCALSAAPDRVAALVSVIGTPDVYAFLYRGGAFCLANAFEWGIGVGERANVPARRIDLPRGLVHRPVYEGDRVALRRVDWVRDWIDHPRRDAFWQRLVPELPARLPAVLSVAGWYDFFLDAQLRDHAALVEAARARGTPPPRLVVGPWAHGVPARLGWWREGMLGHTMRAAVAHFDEHLRGETPRDPRPAVRYFLPGPDAWQTAEAWPPEKTVGRRLHLASRAPDAEAPEPHAARGVLDLAEPEDPQPPLRLRNDPEHPVPSLGGALVGLKAGIKDQRRLDAVADVLVYETGPLERDWTVAGPVSASLHVETDGEDVDVVVHLIDVPPRGRAANVCDGIQRARWQNVDEASGTPAFVEPGAPFRITVDLGAAARTFRAGHRIRIVVAASDFPRFDRNPGTTAPPAHAAADAFRSTGQRVHHEAGRRSWLDLTIREETPQQA